MKRIYKYCLVIVSLSLANAVHSSGSDVDTEHRVTPPTGSNVSSGRTSPPEFQAVREKTREERIQKALAAMARNAEREEGRRTNEGPSKYGRGKMVLY